MVLIKGPRPGFGDHRTQPGGIAIQSNPSLSLVERAEQIPCEYAGICIILDMLASKRCTRAITGNVVPDECYDCMDTVAQPVYIITLNNNLVSELLQLCASSFTRVFSADFSQPVLDRIQFLSVGLLCILVAVIDVTMKADYGHYTASIQFKALRQSNSL